MGTFLLSRYQLFVIFPFETEPMWTHPVGPDPGPGGSAARRFGGGEAMKLRNSAVYMTPRSM